MKSWYLSERWHEVPRQLAMAIPGKRILVLLLSKAVTTKSTTRPGRLLWMRMKIWQCPQAL